jgi:hypothetical protein
MSFLCLNKVRLALVIACSLMIVASGTAIANDFIVGSLRVDLDEVANAWDYKIDLLATSLPENSSSGFTTVWLSVDLDHQPGLDGAKFTQVGLLTDQNGIHWFAYSEAGVGCLRGQVYWRFANGSPKGCLGNIADVVQLNQWHTVELVTYGQGYWIARVYEADGVTARDVVTISSSLERIWDAGATMEEGFLGASDPFMEGTFYLHHPRYQVSNGSFSLWPRSDGNNSTLYALPASICPSHYGATPNIDNNEYKWLAGTGGQICNWTLFPPLLYRYLPLIIK